MRKIGTCLLLLAAPVLADWDASQAPGKPVPADRWGTLEPVQFTNCSSLGHQTPPCVLWTEATRIHPLTEPRKSLWFHDVVAVGAGVWFATGTGAKGFDISNPLRPVPLRFLDGQDLVSTGQSEEDRGAWNPSDKNFYFTSIAAADGVLVGGTEEFGFIAWNISGPYFYHYQDADPFVRDVYAVTVTGKGYAFALDNTAVVRAYNLTAIKSLSKCYQQKDECLGASLGPLALRGPAIGGSLAGTGMFLAHLDFQSLKIYDLSTMDQFPGRPLRVALKATLLGATVLGELALWQSSTRYFLAIAVGTLTGGETWVYDVSCIAGTATCSLLMPWRYDTPDPSTGRIPPPLNLDLSVSNGTPYLYVGTSVIAQNCVPQREYLFDASDPAAMVELTPQVPGKPYWGWYDEECAGYNRTAPRHAVVAPIGDRDALCVARYSMSGCHWIVDKEPDIPPDTGAVIFVDGFESGGLETWAR